jgi:hypothetical protein
MEDKLQEELGLCRDVFVSSRPDDDAIVIGGACQKDGGESTTWNRVMNKRAAHLLWYRLTSFLFPEKAPRVTALVSTAPLSTMTLNSTVTTHADVSRTEDEHYEIKGIIGKTTWIARLNGLEARRLWTALDLALYPNGWEGEKKPQPAVQEAHKPLRRRQTYQ